MTTNSTVAEYCEHAAQEFLQAVVFVDDRIYERSTGAVAAPKHVSAPRQRKSATKTAEQKEQRSALIQDSGQESFEYSPNEIVTSFAKKQIVCSLYQPNREAKASKTSDVVRLCRAADAVIVDWDLHGDKGARALELIAGLIKQAVEDEPEQLRLIILYTQEFNLQGIANDVYEEVTKTVSDFTVVDGEDGLAFHTTNSRVKICGKSGRTRPGISENHTIEDKKLADETIKQFAQLAHGLLQAAALMGLAEIKKNSRKVLSKFGADLDPAFLNHVAMSLPEEDASSHAIPLLVSEIESVLEDVLPRRLLPTSVVRDWCENVWQPGEHLSWLGECDHRAVAQAMCVEGFEAARELCNAVPKPTSGNKKARKAAGMLLPTEDSSANHLFSHLMASRTFYDENRKVLHLGTIVLDDATGKYYLCAQPECDSVRLEGPITFVFLELLKTDPEADGRASHVVITSAQGSVVELWYEAKAYRSYVATFSPDAGTGQVVSSVGGDGRRVFVDESDRSYLWVDQLKIGHAQRAVAQFASDISRVGLTESEWLRLLAKK